MSQQSSNPGGSVFDEVDFQASEPTEGYDPMAEEVYAPAAPQYRKRSFDVYSMLLMLSFFILTTAAILFFMDAAKY